MNKLVPGAAAIIAAALAMPAAAHASPIASCSSGQVQISDAWGQGASGHYAVYLEFSLTPGATACTLTGYPGVVSSWQPAYALVEGRAVDEQGQDCPKYDQLHVTAPDTTETVTLPTAVGCVLQIHPVGSGAPRPATH
jgi:hypothetical protein